MVKDMVLKKLMETPNTMLSGQKIAQSIGVSRTAVWKSILALQKDGFKIEQVPNKGYIFHKPSSKISKSGIIQYLFENIPVIVFDTIDSTNSYALSEIEQFKNTGALIVSLEQTRGRGRFNREFISTANNGIYMSIVLSNNLVPDKVPLVTSAAAVAVSKGIYEVLGIQCNIKWVNDLFIGEKKVCGILTEGITNIETASISHLVVGIGINTSMKGRDKISNIATSIGKNDFDINLLIATIFNNFMKIYNNLAISNLDFMDYYREFSNVIGKKVFVTHVNQGKNKNPILCQALDIDNNGMLVVKMPDSSIIRLSSGEVSLKIF